MLLAVALFILLTQALDLPNDKEINKLIKLTSPSINSHIKCELLSTLNE